MKKIYMKPSTEVVETKLTGLICGSNDITTDKGINYGGIDEEGTKDPASRRYDNWEEDEF